MEQNESTQSTIEAPLEWPPPAEPALPAPPPPPTWTVPTWAREEKPSGKDGAASMRGAKLTLILRALLPLIALISGATLWATHRSQNAAAWHLAQDIGLRQSDFPLGATVDMTQPPEAHQLAPSTPGPCSPVHSQSWLADYDSPTFDPSEHGNDFVSSEVVIMPSSSDAYDALAAIGATGYGSQCFQPAFDEASKAMMPDLSCGAFHFDNSSITEMPNDGFPEATVDYRYVAVMSCTKSGGVYSWDTDIISAQVGGAFIQGIFNSYAGAVPTNIEQMAMNAMAKRAYSSMSGKTPS